MTTKAQLAPRQAQVVLGIDPGTTVTGWGVVSSHGGAIARVDGGQVRLRGDRPAKLDAIFSLVAELCATYVPSAVSLEQSFVGDNVQTAFRLGEARGAVMVAAARARVAVFEYPPASIKIAVAGSGRADKAQMTAMVMRLLGVATEIGADEADALGAAICHLNTSRFDAQVAGAPAVGRGVGPVAGRARASAASRRARWR